MSGGIIGSFASIGKESEDSMPKTIGRKLLILSCSRKKKMGPELQPALERYDGPNFQILRKFILECPAESRNMDIYILSAKFGLIPANQPIPLYDELMTLPRAKELRSQVSAKLRKIFARRKYQELLINLGQAYLPALSGYEPLLPNNLKVVQASGTLGRRQAMLRDWLRGGMSPALPVVPQGRARIRGIEIVLTPEEVMEKASQALALSGNASQAFQSWYVQVDGHRVSPKWLVSQLTGLPVSKFHSDDARQVLRQLGISVRPV